MVLFTANQQSVDGVVDIARRADAARDRMPYDRPPHLVLPVLSRLDNRVEYERAEAWQERVRRDHRTAVPELARPRACRRT